MRTLKTHVLLFEGTFRTTTNGGARTFLATDEVRRLVGQASRIRISIIGTDRTANAELTLRIYDTASPSARPSEIDPGYAAFFTSAPIATLTPAPINVAGPTCDNVDLVLELKASSGTNLEEWTGAIYATLIFE